jgi:hypothetical protein
MRRAARSVAIAVGLGAAAALGLASCGDVPTLEQGIAFISPVQLPAPAVAVGDQLRDSLGNVAPLTVIAYDRDGNVIPGVAVTFVPTQLPAPATVDPTGFVTAHDTVTAVQTIQVVGQVGTRLQTPPASLLIVTQPDSIARSTPEVQTASLPVIDTLGTVVTGLNGQGQRVAVPGILVRYRVTGVYPTASATANVVLTAGTVVSRPDSLFSVDTTRATTGASSRTLVVSGTGVDSVVVLAWATSLRGARLRGDSVHFVLRVTH